MRPRLIIALALMCLAAKGDEEYSKADCKEVGYYIAESDAMLYYVWRCEDPHKPTTKDEKLRCEGMAELTVYLAKEMARRAGTSIPPEYICSDRRK